MVSVNLDLKIAGVGPTSFDPNISSTPRHTVLVVEDKEMLLRLLTDYLRSAGYEVLSARNGREALELLDGRNVDLIISDMRMPEVDGLEFVRRRRQEIPFILLSADIQELQREGKLEGLNLAATIEKPYSFSEIECQISRLLE